MILKNYSYRKLALTYVIWCSCWVGLQGFALHFTFGFPWRLALLDAAITNLLLALAGYAMISGMRFYQPNQVGRLLISVMFSGLCMLIFMQTMKGFEIEDPFYYEFLERSMVIRALYGWLMVSLISTISWLWSSVKEQQEMEVRNASTEKLAREAELSRIRQQLQPHFLFNSLNSISALAGSRPEQARKMIQQLSDFLRGTLKKDDQQLVTLSEELEHLNLYLEIEKVRFGHRLNTSVVCDPAATAMKMPSLLLQPVVENAIKFGLYDTTGETEITIEGKSEDGYLVIRVRNPFDPGTSAPRQGTGYGLSSVQRRLYLLYARQDLLTTEQNENIFTTLIKIPQ
ncbi:MAG TPA: histidine kinase [Chryseosolibacter sp.]